MYILFVQLQLRNVSPTEKEIEELQLENIVDIDADIVGRPPPSLRGAHTSTCAYISCTHIFLHIHIPCTPFNTAQSPLF